MPDIKSWIFGHNDMGDYIECPKCKHKIDLINVRFGNTGYSECPFCHQMMDLSMLDYDRIIELTRPDS